MASSKHQIDLGSDDIDEVTLARIRKQRDVARVHGYEAPAKFVDAWVRGVKIVGEQYFECKTPLSGDAVTEFETLNDVTDKNQLTPKWDFIEKNIYAMSGGEAALLATMCSFYNAEWGGKMMQEFGLQGMADISAKLDLEGNQIVADLLINYTGW